MPPKSIDLNFPKPSGPVDLLVVAGDTSGDEHAALWVKSLKQKYPKVAVAALGGEGLAESGAQLLYRLTDHAVIGFVEVLHQYAALRAVFEALIAWVRDYQPKRLCLVDYPGFNLRVAKHLKEEGISKKGGGSVEVLYYVAPQVWAWKAKRRFMMAEVLDALAVIFPFEVDVFKDTSLPTTFVGHPFVADGHLPQFHYAPDAPLLLLPGSRRGAVAKIFPILLASFCRWRRQHPGARAVVAYPNDSIRQLLERLLEQNRGSEAVTLSKCQPGQTGRAALMSSGTISLSAALAGIPGTIVYRTHPSTYWVARALAKVAYIGIANLLLNEPLYPEYIQDKAKPRLQSELDSLFNSTERLERTQSATVRLRSLLRSDATMAPEDWVMAER